MYTYTHIHITTIIKEVMNLRGSGKGAGLERGMGRNVNTVLMKFSKKDNLKLKKKILGRGGHSLIF